jgi:hypothetical protein
MSEKIKDTIIVVGVTETDGFGNLFVTPQGGGDKIKIGVKRQHLYPLFEQGRAVMLHWETYMNKPYVADAKLVEGELPPPVKPEVPEEYPDKEQIPKTRGEFSPQEVGMWWKEVGEWLRGGEEIEQRFADAYWDRMSKVLGIKISGISTPLATKQPKIEPTAEEMTLDQLKEKVTKKMGWKQSSTAYSWMVNKCKLTEEELNENPAGCWEKIKELMGWTD